MAGASIQRPRWVCWAILGAGGKQTKSTRKSRVISPWCFRSRLRRGRSSIERPGRDKVTWNCTTPCLARTRFVSKRRRPARRRKGKGAGVEGGAVTVRDRQDWQPSTRRPRQKRSTRRNKRRPHKTTRIVAERARRSYLTNTRPHDLVSGAVTLRGRAKAKDKSKEKGRVCADGVLLVAERKKAQGR